MAEGHGYNLYVADLLQHFGVPKVDVPAFTIATTHDEIKEMTENEKDIIVDDLVLEVKSSSRAFTDSTISLQTIAPSCPTKDWPFDGSKPGSSDWRTTE